ncbi:hypothetical protein THAOC_24153, partial [Thalassiosira oceanica]
MFLRLNPELFPEVFLFLTTNTAPQEEELGSRRSLPRLLNGNHSRASRAISGLIYGGGVEEGALTVTKAEFYPGALTSKLPLNNILDQSYEAMYLPDRSISGHSIR